MITTLERLFIAAIGAVSMLFIYGLLSMAWAGADPGIPIRFTLNITNNGNVQHDGPTFATKKECEEEGAYLLDHGKIRDFYCY